MKREMLEGLIDPETEAVVDFTMSDGGAYVKTYHRIVDAPREPAWKRDFAGELEQTLHRLLDAGAGETDISLILGLSKPKGRAFDDACYDGEFSWVDLGWGFWPVDVVSVEPAPAETKAA